MFQTFYPTVFTLKNAITPPSGISPLSIITPLSAVTPLSTITPLSAITPLSTITPLRPTPLLVLHHIVYFPDWISLFFFTNLYRYSAAVYRCVS